MAQLDYTQHSDRYTNPVAFWLGKRGPYWYDADEPYVSAAEAANDPDLIADSTNVASFRTAGTAIIETAPASDNQAVRMVDLTGGLADVAIPAGFKLIFKGPPDLELVWTGDKLIAMVSGAFVGSLLSLT